MAQNTFGRYEPIGLPEDDVNALARAMQDELRRVADALSGQSQQYIYLEVQNSPPEVLTEGMIARADGTNWNPGSGAGVYCYQNGGWTLLG